MSKAWAFASVITVLNATTASVCAFTSSKVAESFSKTAFAEVKTSRAVWTAVESASCADFNFSSNVWILAFKISFLTFSTIDGRLVASSFLGVASCFSTIAASSFLADAISCFSAVVAFCFSAITASSFFSATAVLSIAVEGFTSSADTIPPAKKNNPLAIITLATPWLNLRIPKRWNRFVTVCLLFLPTKSSPF